MSDYACITLSRIDHVLVQGRRRLRGAQDGAEQSLEDDARAARQTLGALTRKGKEVVRKPLKLPANDPSGALRSRARDLIGIADKENSNGEIIASFQSHISSPRL